MWAIGFGTSYDQSEWDAHNQPPWASPIQWFDTDLEWDWLLDRNTRCILNSLKLRAANEGVKKIWWNWNFTHRWVTSRSFNPNLLMNWCGPARHGCCTNRIDEHVSCMCFLVYTQLISDWKFVPSSNFLFHYLLSPSFSRFHAMVWAFPNVLLNPYCHLGAFPIHSLIHVKIWGFPNLLLNTISDLGDFLICYWFTKTRWIIQLSLQKIYIIHRLLCYLSTMIY